MSIDVEFRDELLRCVIEALDAIYSSGAPAGAVFDQAVGVVNALLDDYELIPLDEAEVTWTACALHDGHDNDQWRPVGADGSRELALSEREAWRRSRATPPGTTLGIMRRVSSSWQVTSEPTITTPPAGPAAQRGGLLGPPPADGPCHL